MNQLIKIKTKQNKTNFHEHNGTFSVIVREYEFIRPDNFRIDYIINKCATYCYNKNFHTFKHRCIYYIEMKNGDFVNGIVSDK